MADFGRESGSVGFERPCRGACVATDGRSRRFIADAASSGGRREVPAGGFLRCPQLGLHSRGARDQDCILV